MYIKKARGKILGADLTAAERKALDIEIQKQFAEISRKHATEVDALFLWCLHTQCGFGYKRLKRFYDAFSLTINDLSNRYEMKDAEQFWLCTRMLKEYGVDLEEWRKEKK